MCVPMVVREQWILPNWNYRQLWATSCGCWKLVLSSSARVASSTFKYRTISLHPMSQTLQVECFCFSNPGYLVQESFEASRHILIHCNKQACVCLVFLGVTTPFPRIIGAYTPHLLRRPCTFTRLPVALWHSSPTESLWAPIGSTYVIWKQF